MRLFVIWETVEEEPNPRSSCTDVFGWVMWTFYCVKGQWREQICCYLKKQWFHVLRFHLNDRSVLVIIPPSVVSACPVLKISTKLSNLGDVDRNSQEKMKKNVFKTKKSSVQTVSTVKFLHWISNEQPGFSHCCGRKGLSKVGEGCHAPPAVSVTPRTTDWNKQVINLLMKERSGGDRSPELSLCELTGIVSWAPPPPCCTVILCVHHTSPVGQTRSGWLKYNSFSACNSLN